MIYYICVHVSVRKRALSKTDVFLFDTHDSNNELLNKQNSNAVRKLDKE